MSDEEALSKLREYVNKYVAIGRREDLVQDAFTKWLEGGRAEDPVALARRHGDNEDHRSTRRGKADVAKAAQIAAGSLSEHSRKGGVEMPGELSPEQLQRATIADCEERFKRATGRDWDPRNPEVDELHLLLEQGERVAAREQRAVKALEQLGRAVAELESVVEDDEEDDVRRADGRLLTGNLPSVGSATLQARDIVRGGWPPALRRLLDQPTVEARGIGALRSATQRLARYLSEFTSEPPTPTMLAVVWLLLDPKEHWPSLRTVARLPSEVIDGVAKTLEAAQKAAGRAEDPAEQAQVDEIARALEDLTGKDKT